MEEHLSFSSRSSSRGSEREKEEEEEVERKEEKKIILLGGTNGKFRPEIESVQSKKTRYQYGEQISDDIVLSFGVSEYGTTYKRENNRK